MNDLLRQKWFLLGPPWARSDQAGFTILAGDEDPHIGKIIGDTQDFNDERDDDVSRAIAAHIVELHNSSLVKAAAVASVEMITAYLEAHGARAGVADGWRLVPIEPTDEMIGDAYGIEDYREVWSVMLEAAPSHNDEKK